MFGYVGPWKAALTEDDSQRFGAYYCAVCKQMSRAARFTLSFDCAFLAVSLDACGKPCTCESRRCPVNPLKKKPMALCDATAYAADINTLLAYYNICDDIQDGGGWKKRIVKWILTPAYRRASKAREKEDAWIRDSLAMIRQGELERCDNSDAMAHAFAVLLQTIAAPGADRQGPLGRMFYNIGRWIYLVDAINDFHEDMKKKNYNVLALEWPDYETAREAMDFTLWHTLSEAETAMQTLVPHVSLRPIMENVLQVALPRATLAALGEDGQQTESV